MLLDQFSAGCVNHCNEMDFASGQTSPLRLIVVFMKSTLSIAIVILTISTTQGSAAQIGYTFIITTAYANGDPFPNRIDDNFIEPDTGFFQVANTGETTFTGIIATTAASSFAGDLSWTSSMLVLEPAASVSVGIPDDSSAVGGFNGPYYFYRPGIEISLIGSVSNGIHTEPLDLEVADRDIHSGMWRTDPFGLATDSFVLQGGDPWGFNNGDVFALTQAYGVAILNQPVTEPAALAVLSAPVLGLFGARLLGRRGAYTEHVAA